MLILRNMMIFSGSGMCVLAHPDPLVEMPVAIVHPRPLVQITHHRHGGRQLGPATEVHGVVGPGDLPAILRRDRSVLTPPGQPVLSFPGTDLGHECGWRWPDQLGRRSIRFERAHDRSRPHRIGAAVCRADQCLART
jgi:hypothetical protein